MTRQEKIMVFVFIGWLSCLCLGVDSPYLGQEPPGMIPEVFAPDLVSLPNRCEVGGFFSPDMNEFYFTQTDGRWTWTKNLMTALQDGVWSTPYYVPYDFLNDALCRFLPGDSQHMYFFRYSPSTNSDVWGTTRMANGWGPPERLPAPINSSTAEWGFTQALDGALYISSRRLGSADIFRIETINGQYVSAVPISTVNTSNEENGPHVTPDHKYLMFHSNRPGGFGKNDLYVSRRQGDGSWSDPVNMGPTINTAIEQWDPKLSPDGKYLFYIHRTGWSTNNEKSDIYWVDVGAVLPDPNGPIQNLTSGQRFRSIQCAINYAANGEEIVLSPGTYREYINLTGKNVMLRSADPTDPNVTEVTVVEGDNENPVVTFSGNNTTCTLRGLTITGGLTGLELKQAAPLIEHCRIIENASDGIHMKDLSQPTISHTLICANGGAGILMTGYQELDETIPDEPELMNCTIAQNTQEGIKGGIVAMRNCIVYTNGIIQLSPASATVSYSCIQGGYAGTSNIDNDPLFVRLAHWEGDPNDPNDNIWIPGDYHLKSQAGRYDPNSMDWVLDEVTSPCIDAGDPNSDVGDEPDPNGGIINLGAYGGTIQASKTLEED
jgi:hypothetical protein